MRQELSRKTIGLSLLCLLPVVLLPSMQFIKQTFNQIRSEQQMRQAQQKMRQDVEMSYQTDEPSGHCLPQLIYWVKAHPYANHIRITGWFAAGSSSFSREISYSRQKSTISHISEDLWEGGGNRFETTYHGVTDGLLRKFAGKPKTRYFSDFDSFCRANGCRVEEK